MHVYSFWMWLQKLDFIWSLGFKLIQAKIEKKHFGDGERKGDDFGEVLDLAAQKLLQCFSVVRKIL